VVILPDSGERYLSSALFDEQGLAKKIAKAILLPDLAMGS
jgi:hypothetical protein